MSDTTSEFKSAVKDLNDAFVEFKNANEEKMEQLESKGVVAEELKTKIVDIQEKIEVLDEIKTRLEKAELKIGRPQMPKGSTPEIEEVKEQHYDAWEQWVRNPTDMEAKRAIYTAEKKSKEVFMGMTPKQKREVKADGVYTLDPASGGHAVPIVVAREIEAKLLDLSPMRQISRVQQVGTPQYSELVNVRGAGFGWIGESTPPAVPAIPTTDRGATATSELRSVTPTFGMAYAYPSATEESLQDIFFDVAGWIIEESSEYLSKAEGAAFVAGDGSDKPTGVLTAPVSTDVDGVRTFGTLQDTAPLDFSLLSTVVSDQLVDVVMSLKAGYRRNARWVMNKATMAQLAKVKDGDGNYVFSIDRSAGPILGSLLGFPVVEDEEWEAIGTGNHPVAFGDFSGYLIADISGIRMTVDEITAPGYVKYYIRKRVGGILKNDDKIKLIESA